MKRRIEGRRKAFFVVCGYEVRCGFSGDSAGRVSKLIYPDASEVTRTYTGRGQLHKLITNLTTLDERSYDNGGRLTSSVYANGLSESRTYNADGTLSNIQFSGAAIGDLSYSWDDNHNKTSEAIGGVMSGYGFTANYDAEDRLVEWDRADAALDQSWNLSPVGDWQKFTENSVAQNRTHGPSHELTAAGGQTVTHDAKGNITTLPSSLRPQASSLTWDFDNRMSSADVNNDGTDDVFYQFDALGRRVARTASSTTTVYVPNGQQTLADYASGASPSSPQYTYVWGDYIDELVVRDGSGGQRFYHRNQQFSIVALTDSAGAITERYAYDAYGELTITDAAGVLRSASTESNRYLYTGREWDEALGLYHYRARMYDPVAGRFCSRDPIGYVDGTCLYMSYFGIGSTDPSGLYRYRRPEWQFPDFAGHYAFGGGKLFVLNRDQMQHFINGASGSMQLAKNLARADASAAPCGSSGSYSGYEEFNGGADSQPFQVDDPSGSIWAFIDGKYILNSGRAFVSWNCRFSSECCDCSEETKSINVSCTINVTYRDRFANPTDINGPYFEHNKHKYNKCYQDCVSKWESANLDWWQRRDVRIGCSEMCLKDNPKTDHFGTPFNIYGRYSATEDLSIDLGCGG